MEENRFYARKCRLKQITSKEAEEFFQQNHDMGWPQVHHNFIVYGLYYNNELISSAAFGFSRWKRLVRWELIRFCSKKDCWVLGGLSKLTKNFASIYGGDIISYCHLGRSNGEGYHKAGFQQLGGLIDGYYWSTPDGKKLTRYETQKRKLLKNPYTKIKAKELTLVATEKEICEASGLKKIKNPQLLFYWPPNNIPIGYVYKLTNLDNNTIYIGKHYSIKGQVDENYWSSSEVIKKLNIKNLKKEVLFWAYSGKELAEKEIEYIKEQEKTYNIHHLVSEDKLNKRRIIDEEAYNIWKKNIGRKLKEFWQNNPEFNKERSLKIKQAYNEERKNKHSVKMKEFFKNNPEIVLAHSEFMKDFWKDNEKQIQHSEFMKNFHTENPEIKNKVKEFWSTHPELKKQYSLRMNEFFKLYPEYKQKHSEFMKQWFLNHPEEYEKRSTQMKQNMKRFWDDEEKVQEWKEKMGRNYWHNEEKMKEKAKITSQAWKNRKDKLQVVINGIDYGTLENACKKLNLNIVKLSKLIKEGTVNEKWQTAIKKKIIKQFKIEWVGDFGVKIDDIFYESAKALSKKLNLGYSRLSLIFREKNKEKLNKYLNGKLI